MAKLSNSKSALQRQADGNYIYLNLFTDVITRRHKKKPAKPYDVLIDTVQRVTKKGCWIITKGVNPNGYAYIIHEGKKRSAHRVSYSIFNGKLEPGKYICHTCDNPTCVNPSHLFQDTPTANMMDAVNKGRFPQEFKKGNIPHNRSLTDSQVKEVKKAFIDFPLLSCRQIAEKTKVNYFIVKDIKRGRNYANV